MEQKTEQEKTENPLEPYLDSLRQQLEDQDPVILIGVIVAVAVVVITCGKTAHVSLACSLASCV